MSIRDSLKPVGRNRETGETFASMALAFETISRDLDEPLLPASSHYTSVQRPVQVSTPSRTHADAMLRAQLANDIYVLLPRASERVAIFCAEMLISTGTMTPALAFAFLARGDASTRVALAGAEHIPTSIILHRALHGMIDEARAIASRPELDSLTVSALVDRHDPLIDRLLAETITLTDTSRAICHLIRRAQHDKILARILLDRDDLAFDQRIQLFESASPVQRAALMHEIHHQPDILAQTPMMNDIGVAAIRGALAHEDHESLFDGLAIVFDCKLHDLIVRLSHPDGAISALALLALGLTPTDIRHANRLIGIDTHASQRPGGAEDVMEQLTAETARALFFAILGQNRTPRQKRAHDLSDATHQGEAALAQSEAA